MSQNKTHYPHHLDLKPVMHVEGAVRLPGSKSISNRFLLLAALAAGETHLHDVLDADDTRHMLAALRALGVDCTSDGAGGVRVCGAGGAFKVKQAELFLGNAGTAFRPLTAVLALCNGDYRLSGVPRMHERPIGDLVDALQSLGARIEYEGAQGFPPLHIRPAAIEGGVVSIRGNVSSQYLTALLLAALRRSGVDAVPMKPVQTGCVRRGGLLVAPDLELALAAAGRVVGEEMTGERQRRLVADFLAETAPELRN